mgnify:CR=1 FL=1
MVSLTVDALPLNLVLALLVMASVMNVGCAIVQFIARSPLHGRQLLAYGVGAGIAAHALFGIAILCFPPDMYQPAAAALLVIGNILASGYAIKCRLIGRLLADGRWQIVVMLVAWAGLSLSAVLATFVPVRSPQPLPDPMYVLKRDHLHVRIQTLTGGLPADNYLPYAVGEYLLRGIQLSQERPLLPGQEVSNRPILMSLAVVPFRAALDPPPQMPGRLPRFDYVGTSWPDAGVVGEDRYFRPFLTVATVFNASIMVATVLLLLDLGLSRRYVLAGVLLLCSSPYMINQTLFTWPKMMAATYVLLAAHAIFYRRNYALAGGLAALAYWSHPYAIVIALSFGLFAAVGEGMSRLRIKPAMVYTATFAAIVLPWFLWSHVYLGIPSDLVQQNMGQELGWSDRVWVRVANFYNTLAPTYLGSYPFDGEKFVQGSLVSLTGITGLLFFIQGYAGCVAYYREHRDLVLFAVLIPTLLLIGVFGILTVPALHGLQAVGPLVLLLGLKWMQDNWRPGTLWLLVFSQVLLNLVMFYFRARSVL